MRTLSVKLPDGLDARLTAVARQRRTSKSALARKALEAVLHELGKAYEETLARYAARLTGVYPKGALRTLRREWRSSSSTRKQV